jgi:hypothetical protein
MAACGGRAGIDALAYLLNYSSAYYEIKPTRATFRRPSGLDAPPYSTMMASLCEGRHRLLSARHRYVTPSDLCGTST